MDDMAWFMLGLHKGRKEGGGTISLHDLFLQQETIAEIPLIGEYKQVFKWMPDYSGQSAAYQFSDYTNDSATGYLFAIWKISQYKQYAVGMYRGDEYLGICMTYGQYTHCDTIYSPNNDYTNIYLSQKDVLKDIQLDLSNTIKNYNYNSVTVSGAVYNINIERTTYTESGNVSKTTVTETQGGQAFGIFNMLQYQYADADRVAECIEEYARLCNAKYHEING